MNLEGLAIGNGEFSDIKDINTALTLSYMKGFHSKAYVQNEGDLGFEAIYNYRIKLKPLTFCACSEYESMGKCVPDDFDGPMSTFDFTQ